jgi:hypothetical protein
MATALISFEDTPDGVLMSLEFQEDLPDDPNDASDAQAQAMIAYSAFLSWSQDDYDVAADGEALPEV